MHGSTIELDDVFSVRRLDGSLLTHTPAELELIAPDAIMTRKEADAFYDRAKNSGRDFLVALLQLKQRDGWRALGFASWASLTDKLASEIGVDSRTVERQVEAAEIKANIGRNLPDSHARELKGFDADEQKSIYERAREIQQAAPTPVGKAATFYNPYKPSRAAIQQAKAERSETLAYTHFSDTNDETDNVVIDLGQIALNPPRTPSTGKSSAAPISPKQNDAPIDAGADDEAPKKVASFVRIYASDPQIVQVVFYLPELNEYGVVPIRKIDLP